MTELLVGTKKGLFVLDGEPGAEFDVKARAFAGEPVEYATRDRRSGRMLAAVISPFYGPKIWYADDPSGEWEQNRALWEEPTRPDWQPGGGGLCLHSIVTWPGDPDRLALGISAAGVWLTEDGGKTWRQGNQGLVARYLPDDLPDVSPAENLALCVHNMQRAPQRPERMFMQFHGGVYRSDDAGESWAEIGAGLPSDFGFPMVLDPGDPDSAYVIPLNADVDRVTPGGHVRVYETRDAGSTWTEHGDGLPQKDAYLTVLRHAFDRSGEGPALALYFGTTTGEVFGSADAGASWFTVATHLPPVYSARVAG